MKKLLILFVSLAFATFFLTACSNSPIPLSSAKAVTAFSFNNPSAVGVIDEAAKTVTVVVPYGVDVTALVASFATTGLSVAVGNTPQVSGTTSNDFTNPVVYKVYAADGSSAAYTATVSFGTFVFLQSDAGDFIGQGHNYAYSLTNAAISISATDGLLTISIQGDERWGGDFKEPDSMTRLQIGTYANLIRYPFHNPAQGGLSWYGEGRGCNILTGSFTIDKVEYESENLTGVALRFEQHCEGHTPALRGRIHWTASDHSVPPGPVYPIPPDLWHPAPGSTPVTGRYIYLQSDPQDHIGQGQTYTYTPNDFQISLSETSGYLSVRINGSDWWFGDFRTMNSRNQFQPGYYGGLKRYPFHNPARGGLSWYGEGRGCNTLTGWFAVDNVTYNSGILEAIDLRFEQHCDGLPPALHGKIHWTP